MVGVGGDTQPSRECEEGERWRFEWLWAGCQSSSPLEAVAVDRVTETLTITGARAGRLQISRAGANPRLCRAGRLRARDRAQYARRFAWLAWYLLARRSDRHAMPTDDAMRASEPRAPPAATTPRGAHTPPLYARSTWPPTKPPIAIGNTPRPPVPLAAPVPSQSTGRLRQVGLATRKAQLDRRWMGGSTSAPRPPHSPSSQSAPQSQTKVWRTRSGA